MADQTTTNQATNRPTTGTNRGVGGRVADWLGAAFYVVVASVALAGQTGAAVVWLHWPVLPALLAVAALELGGIALAARADFRRRLGERAVAARLLSAAVAVFAVVFNWAGHTDHLAGGFFAGMSGLGYSVWLIQAGDRRRDQLRAAGKLPEVPPAYPVTLWLRHPWTTRRARDLAKATPELGLYGSLSAAATAARTERRQAAIATVLHRQIQASADPDAAEIAVTVFDLDEIADRLAARANYDGFTDLIAVGLDPERLLTARQDAPNRVDDRAADGARPPDRSPRTPRPTTNRTSGGRPPLTVVGESAVVANARRLRELYPDRLPASERAIRTATGWSKVRVEKAVAVYRSGADLGGSSESDDQERHLVASGAGA